MEGRVGSGRGGAASFRLRASVPRPSFRRLWRLMNAVAEAKSCGVGHREMRGGCMWREGVRGTKDSLF